MKFHATVVFEFSAKDVGEATGDPAADLARSGPRRTESYRLSAAAR